MMSTKETVKEEIINQLLQFGIGTKEEIINAMNNVINKHDINEIADYIINNQQKKDLKSINGDGDDNKSVK